MHLRPATFDDIPAIADLVVGDESQASTRAGMRLFSIETRSDALELNRVMISSTQSWESTTVAEDDGLVGMIQVGEASMAFTPEIIGLAHRLYGDGFQAFLGPRLEAQGRVHASYPDGCLRISEVHVAPAQRGHGVGSVLLGAAIDHARNQGFTQLGLQTLTTNPALAAFEAWGFETVETMTDPEFESLTGASGFHLMVRSI